MKLTKKAVEKVLEIIRTTEPTAIGLRVAITGGGCAGFSYNMSLAKAANTLDKTYEFENIAGDQKLKVLVDPGSLLYLESCEIDYIETLEASGFKFNNPNVKSTCGCGSSFSA